MSTLRICGLFAALALAVSAMAYPTLSGPTGSVALPSAYTAGSGVTAAADFVNLGDDASMIPVRALIGIGSNVELGATLLTFDDATLEGAKLDTSWDANAKWAFTQLFGGKTAIGAQFLRLEGTDLFTDTDVHADFTQAYLAWTRLFCFSEGKQSLALTLGTDWTQLKPETGDTEDAFRYFTSLELGLTPMFSVVADYQTKDTDLGDISPISSIAGRIRINPTIAVQFGSTNALGPIGLDDHNFFAGLNLNFGKAAE